MHDAKTPPVEAGFPGKKPEETDKSRRGRQAAETARDNIRRHHEELERERTLKLAKEAYFVCVPEWCFYLKLSPLAKMTLGLILGLQDERDGFRMSLSRAGAMLNVKQRQNSKKAIDKLCAAGYVTKEKDAGELKRATYRVDVLLCVEEALSNGWAGRAALAVKRALDAGDPDRAIRAAKKARYSRLSEWICHLDDISRLEQIVLGRLYSFQLTANKDGSPGEYRMSHATGGEDLGIDRSNLARALKKLAECGYVTKRGNGKKANGEARPATYTVDVPACIAAARENGWKG